MKGVVIKSTGSWFSVRTDTGFVAGCKLKGNFRMKGIKTTNPLAVGDKVEFDYRDEEKVGLINKILPRYNYIIRKSTKLSKVSHIIAANIDLALLVVTIREPRTSVGFIDRFLVTAEAYHIPAALVFNKIDIYGEPDFLQLDNLTRIYEAAGYKTFRVSALTGRNITDVKSEIKDKVSLFSGISGVGKSQLVNAIVPGLKLKTGDISEYHLKGKHTTTFPEMHSLSFGGFIIDTPGIREFGLVKFRKEEIAERFPEMRRYMHECQFNNCTHTHEPHCAVKEAVKNGKIALSRYESYLRIFNDDYLEKEAWEWE
ncbi:MAG: ribosome small subunit-dependent GTPase A [Sphingobacteriia bacterium]|nr:ribosome small subunit-dependent GTPase A [Sphingobacteriia bacterium]